MAWGLVEGIPTSSAAFGAATEQRLRSLERELAEVKGRINGLTFLVAGAVIGQTAPVLVDRGGQPWGSERKAPWTPRF